MILSYIVHKFAHFSTLKCLRKLSTTDRENLGPGSFSKTQRPFSVWVFCANIKAAMLCALYCLNVYLEVTCSDGEVAARAQKGPYGKFVPPPERFNPAMSTDPARITNGNPSPQSVSSIKYLLLNSPRPFVTRPRIGSTFEHRWHRCPFL